MKPFVHTLLLSALLALSSLAASQVRIPGTDISFGLDSDKWRYMRTFKTAGDADIHLYCYVGHTVVDSQQDTIIPFLRIYTDSRYTGDLYSLVYDRYTQQPYQSLYEYSHGPGIPASGGLGYKGAYTNLSDHTDYIFLMTYFKDKKTFVEFRLETTKDTFDQMEAEFNRILKTIK